jgi:hypothetical protein
MGSWIWLFVIGGDLAAAYGLWDNWRVKRRYVKGAGELERQLMDQVQHGLMLWPHPWMGGRELTQVERITEAGKGWLGDPLDPEEQRKRMLADGQRLLDSYKPPAPRKPPED